MENKLEKFAENNVLRAQTHGGKFHSDDVFATLLIQRYCEFFEMDFILERNDVINPENKLFYDIGEKYDPENGYFDHHQEDENIMHTVKKNNGKIVMEKRSSFGLLWEYLGDIFLEGRAKWVFDTQFVSKIDHFDNYGGSDSICLAIRDLNHKDFYARNAASDAEQFEKAVELARIIFNSKINILRDSQMFIEYVFKDANKRKVRSSGILILDEYIAGTNSALGSKCPWVDFFIAPSGRNDTYNLYTVYTDKNATPKIPLKATDKVVYSHERFLQFNTIEDAIECAKISKEDCTGTSC